MTPLNLDELERLQATISMDDFCVIGEGGTHTIIQDTCFTHDAGLELTGDFANGEAIDYANAVATWLNSRADLLAAARERDRLTAENELLVAILVGIHRLIDPPLVELPDGRQMRFVNPMAAEVLHKLSSRIRDIPDEVARAALAGEKKP